MRSQRRIRARDSIRSSIDSDGAVLMDLEEGVYFSVNSVGAMIWKELVAGTQPARIQESIAHRYGITPEAAENDFESFLKTLKQKGLVDVELC